MQLSLLKKIFKYGLTGILVSGVILVIGFLSFTGMLTLCGLIVLAIGSFTLTGMIEGEVYAQNISQGLDKLLKGKWFESKYLKNAVYLRELKKLTEKQKESSSFLKGHARSLEILEKLHAEKEKLGLLYFFSQDFKKKLAAAEKRIKDEQKYFIDLMEGKLAADDPLTEDFINQAMTGKKAKLLEEIQRKTIFSRLCLGAAILSGCGMGLVFLSVAPESLIASAAFLGIGISASAFPVTLTIVISVFAVIAAIGYMVLIYNTLTDMLQNDALKTAIKKIKKFFSLPEEGMTAKVFFSKLLTFVLILLIIGVGVFATVTTAGTWWYAAKSGIDFLLPYLQRLAPLLSGPLVVLMGLSALLFNLYNTLKSLKQLRAIFSIAFVKKLGAALKKAILSYFDKENIVQFINPFRFIALLIEIPFVFLVFVGHVVATGVMGDRFESVPPLASAIGGAWGDLLVDWHFIFHALLHEEPPEKPPVDDSENTTDLQKPKIQEARLHEHAHEDDAHSHSDIPGKALMIILSPLHALSALWDWAFSHANPEILSGKDAMIKSFFGLRAQNIFAKQNAQSYEMEDMGDLKSEKYLSRVISAHRIHKMLSNEDKSKDFTSHDKEKLKTLRISLIPSNKEKIFEECENGKESNFDSNAAKEFFATLSISSNISHG